MAGRFLWKPIAQGQVGGGRATVLFNNYDPSDQYVSAGIYGPEGQLVENFTLAPRGQPSAELPNPETASKFYGSRPGYAYGDGFYFEAITQSGAKQRYNIPSGGGRYAGDIGNENPQFENKASAPGGMGMGGQFAPGQIGYGFFPAFMGDQFPEFNYNFVDPIKFAEQFGDFSRNELLKNFDISKDLSLKELDLELQAMQGFIPAASALKRGETSLDNQFNQAQRTAQVDQTLPYARSALAAQGARAQTFAEGRLPNEIEDRVLEGSIRNRAADRATFGGFGASSSVARKAADLMSVDERLKLSQYGDQLLNQNLTTSANLLLAPTEYSDAGTQVRVNPSVSPAQLIDKNLGFIHQATSISPGQAFTSQVQQEQFNAQSQFNAGLSKFGYLAQYAGTVAGAAQTNMNTEMALQQQQRYEDIFRDYADKAQSSQEVKDIAGAITTAITAIGNMIGLGQSVTGSSTDGSALPETNIPSEAPSFDPSLPDTGSSDGVSEGVGSPEVSGPSGTGEAPDFTYQPEGGGQDYTLSAESQNFTEDTGINVSPQTARTVVQQGNNVLNSAGISSVPNPVSDNIGVDNAGNPVYSSKVLRLSNDRNLGGDMVTTLKTALQSTGVVTTQDASNLDSLAGAARDASFIARLTDAYQRGDKKDFVNTVLDKFHQPLINEITDDKESRVGLGAAYSAYRLFDNWGRMSPAQRAIGVASTGLQTFQFATGENLAQKPIIDAVYENGKLVTPGLNVGQALQLAQAGYNIYSLVNNWDQYSTIQKVAAGTGTAANVAQLARQFNMLGSGASGAAVPVTAQQLAANGLKTAPNLGNGAIIGNSGSKLPSGYSIVQTNPDGSFVATPTGLENSFIPKVAGAATAIAGAYQVYKGWGTGGTKGALNGALGGSAIVLGLDTMLSSGFIAANPYLAAGILATSVIGNAVQVGKSGDQKGRDGVRNRFVELGLSNKRGEITLADGSTASIGIDGHGNQRNWKDSSKTVDGGKHKLNAWDIDYTNDLDYAAGMGGIALSRIATGGANKAIDQVGGNIGNASLMNIGYGKDMTPENFAKMAQNMRAIYAQSGIKSKADAFQLANQAFAEGRLDDTQLVAAHQAFNFIFDNNGYDTAQKLMAGRGRGIEVAHQQPPPEETKKVEANVPAKVKAASPFYRSKEDIMAANKSKFAFQGATA